MATELKIGQKLEEACTKVGHFFPSELEAVSSPPDMLLARPSSRTDPFTPTTLFLGSRHDDYVDGYDDNGLTICEDTMPTGFAKKSSLLRAAFGECLPGVWHGINVSINWHSQTKTPNGTQLQFWNGVVTDPPVPAFNAVYENVVFGIAINDPALHPAPPFGVEISLTYNKRINNIVQTLLDSGSSVIFWTDPGLKTCMHTGDPTALTQTIVQTAGNSGPFTLVVDWKFF